MPTTKTSYSSLMELNTRVLLGEIGPRATLDDLPDALLDRLKAQGFDWIWMLGAWQTGPAGRQVARENAEWRRRFAEELPGFTEADICGSPFAIRAYSVHADFGGDAALARWRDRLRRRDLRLLLDFVPNHTALDHPWTQSHPEYYIHGSEDDLAREPQNYQRIPTGRGSAVLAHGRDPYFSGWPDTLQLNYRHPGFRQAMIEELKAIAERCDGVRCDMAMLLLPDVIAQTWGDRSRPADGAAPADGLFWPEAVAAVRARRPDFQLLAEVYWDREWALQEQGFDATYDKRLYDRLHGGDASGVRGHLSGALDFQRRCARFMENHDEDRAAAVFPPGQYEAAALVTFLTPGLRFFHDGQFEGRRLRTSIHLTRRAAEAPDAVVAAFYERLLACLQRPEVRGGRWRLLTCRQAWDGNSTWDRFIAFAWDDDAGRRSLICVNYGPTQGQCYVELPADEWHGGKWSLRDLMGDANYQRDGDDLAAHGLYLDVPGWKGQVFEAMRG
jgi:glycosidase